VSPYILYRQFGLSIVVLCIVITSLALPGPLVAQEEESTPASGDAMVTWNTFLGSNHIDLGTGIKIDSNGNSYVVGSSSASWGSPIRAHSSPNTGISDAFVAKINSNGLLQWHTFLGGSYHDLGQGIFLDGSGNIYIVGSAQESWGTPIRAHSGGMDTFVAKLNNNGVLQWHTFVGGGADDYGYAITLVSNTLYVTGASQITWGTPIRPHSGGFDAFVARLNSSGTLQLVTFLGSAGGDTGRDIVASATAVYVVGNSTSSWATPKRAFSGSTDAFVARLDDNLTLVWNTFYGAAADDSGERIALEGPSGVIVTGTSSATWGETPINRHNGGEDAFVVKTDATTGLLTWHTFLGSDENDYGETVARDSSGNIFVAGRSGGGWGPTSRGDNEFLFASKLNASGVLQTNAFFGGERLDFVSGIAVDSAGNMLIGGSGTKNWGTPILPYADRSDALIVKLPAFGSRVGQSIGAISKTPSSIDIGATAQVKATATSGLPVLFTVRGPCSVQGATVTGKAPGGACTIVAHQDGDSTYASAPDVETSLQVRSAQTIAFEPLANKTQADPPFTVSATASSGLAVGFASSTTPVCTVSGNTVTLVAVGTCTIVASQAGNQQFSPALPVSRSFLVVAPGQPTNFIFLPFVRR
jgi:hypothetical protein